jgi:hypothetical protein
MRLRRALAAVAAVSLAFAASILACSCASEPADLDETSDATSSADRREATRTDSDPADALRRDVATKDTAIEHAPDSSHRDGRTRDADKDGTSLIDEGIPSLTSLQVSSTVDSGPALSLVPSFSPDIFDYYVRCAAGTNEITVSMTASPGSSSLLIQPTPSPSLPEQTHALSVEENQAIVAIATNGTATTEYWVRCLPHDFPVLQWTLHPEAGVPTPGYYLLGNAVVHSGESSYAMVLNPNGVPVWYYGATSAVGVYNVDSVVSGAISFLPSGPQPVYEIHYLNPLSTAFLSYSDIHELRALPNGDYLVLRGATALGIDLTGLQAVEPDGGVDSLGSNERIITCDVVELDATGATVWQWTGLDHLDPVKDSTFPAFVGNLPDGGVLVDPFHCNSIDVDFTSGNLLVSARNMDSVFYIERSTGKILWKMGGTLYTKDSATYVPVADPFHRQHDGRFQPGWKPTCSGWSGQISVFDDESGEPAEARAIVYDVVIVPGDAGTDYDSAAIGEGVDGGTAGNCGPAADAGPTGATVAWQYKGWASSGDMGSFRILADGSRVIDWGFTSNHVAFTEVNVDGNDLLDFTIDRTWGGASYRTIKVPMTVFDLNVLRSSAGLP